MALHPIRIATLLLTGVALSALAQEPAPAPTTPAPAVAVATDAVPGDEAVVALSVDPLAPTTHDATFAADMFQPDSLMLQGIMAERVVSFDIPASWTLTGDPELHLQLDHSSTLLEHRSSITVLVNNRAIASAFLDASNVTMGEVVASIPRETLKIGEWNQISIMAAQHYTTECEDPFDPNLWTRVSANSYIRFAYQSKPVERDLAQYPAPFVDVHGLGPSKLTLVAADGVSSTTLDALGNLGLSLGRIADYRGVEVTEVVSSVVEAQTHALLVGTVDSSPDIAMLLSSVELGGDDGVVAIVPNPANPTLAVLVVSGRTRKAVENAAFALAGDNRHEVLSGPYAIIKDTKRAYPATRRSPLPAPGPDTFSLQDMHYKDVTVRGFWSDPVRIPLGLEGDAQPHIDASEMNLHFGYSAQLDNRLSTVEVSLGGVVLASEALTKEAGDDSGLLRVRLPTELLTPNAVVEVRFHLFPKNYKACERVSDRIIWGTVYSDTWFTIERDHFAMMPDLKRLRYDLWPFTLNGTAGSVTIVAPDAPTANDAAAAFTVAAALGYRRTEADPNLHVISAADLGTELPAGNLIVLHSGGNNRVYTGLRQSLGLQETADGRVLTARGESLVDGRFIETYGLIEEIVHPDPDQDQHAILVLHSPSASEILPLAKTLQSQKLLDQLDGNISVIPRQAGAAIRTVHEGAQSQIGQKPFNTQVTQVLSKFWPIFFLLLLGAAVLYALVVSLWARRHGAHT